MPKRKPVTIPPPPLDAKGLVIDLSKEAIRQRQHENAPDEETIKDARGFLWAVALAIGALLLVALMVYMNDRSLRG